VPWGPLTRIMAATRWNALSSTCCQKGCGFAAWFLAPWAMNQPSPSEKSIHLKLQLQHCLAHDLFAMSDAAFRFFLQSFHATG
jgi:hypothetical protein